MNFKPALILHEKLRTNMGIGFPIVCQMQMGPNVTDP